MSSATLHENGAYTAFDTEKFHNQLIAEHQVAAEAIGMDPIVVAELTHVDHAMSGTVEATDPEKGVEVIGVDRFHVGPKDLTAGGGIKFKGYESPREAQVDAAKHAAAMFTKAGILDEDFKGGKTIANFGYNSDEQDEEAMRAIAWLMHKAGLTDWRRDKPAGDERTNTLIDAYVDEAGLIGVEFPYTTITGKSDMTLRPAATGDFAAVTEREYMRLTGQLLSRSALQGAGFAGAYYAAEAFDPQNETGDYPRLIVPAIGEMRRDKVKEVLYTDHPEGLPITHKMANSVLLDPTDRDMQATHHDKLRAFARKIERTGREVHIVDKDILTFEDADRLTLAATSKTVNEDTFEGIKIPNWLLIANEAYDRKLEAAMKARGVNFIPSQVASSGGFAMSNVERRRDLARMEAEKKGYEFKAEDDSVYRAEVHGRMTRATRQYHAFAEAFHLSPLDVARAVSLGNFAITHGAHIDRTALDILTAQ